MIKIIYNYHFDSSEYGGVIKYGLVTGGPRIGTMGSGGWNFDGQIFTRAKEHPYYGRIENSDLKIVTVQYEELPQ